MSDREGTRATEPAKAGSRRRKGRGRERAICERLSAMLPSGRMNACYESDAEIIRLAGTSFLFTTDEFSGEDLLEEVDPYTLGWNMAAGGISDILACGGVPLYYAHALTVAPAWDQRFIEGLGRGIRAVLRATDARFIGGDVGQSRAWRCTVSVLGTCQGNVITRRGGMPGDGVYLSGPVGAGNLQAARSLGLVEWGAGEGREAKRTRSQLVFPLRQAASGLMRRFASACLDSSDGVFAALQALSEVNGCGYRVDRLPYLPEGTRALRSAGLPPLLLFLGGCGEYELVFTVRRDRERRMEAEARRAGCLVHRIGRLTPTGQILVERGRELDLKSFPAEARDYVDPHKYLRGVMGWLRDKGIRAVRPAPAERGRVRVIRSGRQRDRQEEGRP